MPTNAVLDASVLVSAFLFPQSVPGRVLRFGRDGLFAIHLSEILMEEVRRSLSSPRLQKSYPHDKKDIQTWISALRREAFILTKPLPQIAPTCRDPNDDHVIACAIATKSDFIVTGDLDLLDLERHKHIQIITPREFLDRLELD